MASAALTLLFVAAPWAWAEDSPAVEWPLDQQHFQADAVWSHSRGTGIIVAVLDTGVDAQHPDLSGQVIPGTGFMGEAGDTGQSDLSGDSHGTSIAAIIAGSGAGNNGNGMIGLAPKARILPVRVSFGASVEPITLAKGIFYATDHHANIINISEGTPDPDPTIRAAINYALAHNVVMVAAAGNSGQQGNTVNYPAAFPGVVAVTGVDRNNRFWAGSNAGPAATLAAPATDIYSAAHNDQYLTGQGTSYAAPYVSAAAALVWSQHPSLTAGQVIRQLITNADPHGVRPHNDQYGYGILDPLHALSATPSADTTNPLLTPQRPTATKPSDNSVIIAFSTCIGLLVLGLIIVTYWRRSRHQTRTRQQGQRKSIERKQRR